MLNARGLGTPQTFEVYLTSLQARKLAVALVLLELFLHFRFWMVGVDAGFEP
jgi:hypothetical protein